MMWGILNEEMGMGDVKHNHCDLYASLLHSVDIFLPDVRTRAFVDDPGFLPSAFTGSAYALALVRCVVALLRGAWRMVVMTV